MDCKSVSLLQLLPFLQTLIDISLLLLFPPHSLDLVNIYPFIPLLSS